MKIIRWTALVIGTVINVLFSLITLIFIGAALIGDFQTNSMPEFMLWDSLFILGYVLCIIAIVIGWFNSKIGGFLMIICAALLLFLPERNLILGEKLWHPYVIISING
jgi:hypothetical protein